MGRPKSTPGKLTEAKLAEICAAVAAGATRRAACLASGVSHRALNYCCQEKPAVAEALARADAECQVRLEKVVMAAATATVVDIAAAKFILERKYWKVWARRSPDAITPQQFMVAIARVTTEMMSEIPPENQERARLKLQAILNDSSLFATQAKTRD